MAAQQPSSRAYTVVKRKGHDDFWLAIGAAFMHHDGDGYNVVLQALPIVCSGNRRTIKQTSPPRSRLTAGTNPALDAGSKSRRQAPRLFYFDPSVYANDAITSVYSKWCSSYFGAALVVPANLKSGAFVN
jgi:hypothetical protein